MVIDLRIFAKELDGTEVIGVEMLGTVLNGWLYKYVERLPEMSATDVVDIMSTTGMLMHDAERGTFLFTVSDQARKLGQ